MNESVPPVTVGTEETPVVREEPKVEQLIDVSDSLQTTLVIEDEKPKEEPKKEEVSSEQVMRDFLDYESRMSHTDFIKKFYDIRLDQEKIRAEPDYCSLAAINPVHFQRNRYRDILPYDYNRVSISQCPENPDGYMNASFISLPGGKTTFVAAQAPLPATLNEWWKMIEEKEITLVLMLCRLMEMSKIKCERYWPETKNEPEIFGDYEITLLDETKFDGDDEYVLRTLQFENTTTGNKRQLKQLHYREWPDHGCPTGEDQLLRMIDKMAEILEGSTAPVLVHCSAGVGRTGTIIAVNYVRELMEQNTLKSLDLYDIVMQLRKQRASMVQTQDQYQFVHKCVAHYCRRRLGLPEPKPISPKVPVLEPVQAYICVDPQPNSQNNDDKETTEGTIVPDFPHEPPAPSGPEGLSSAAS